MSDTKIKSSLSSKFKKTQVNSIQKLPDITGHTLGEFYADSRLDIVSGEADIYLCSGTGSLSGKKFLLKYYRRENAVKPDVLEKLKGVSSPFVATVEGFGEYMGHQYVIRPYYEMSALSELLAEGTRFSEEELKTLIIPSIIEGLKVVHDSGILHKDLKPANLIPDDSGEHIVLIDFGISSDAGKNTFVVTHTGMTPFYAAPEAMQGIFHKETDYYAFGITIFELFTGFTPFQNPGLTPEAAARLASVSKIEFPENFPENLKRLVLGLTYKDISHRNENDNPNRRWGYDEVRKWLKGENVPVPGENEASGQKTKFLPYSFGGVKHQTLESLVKAMLKDPAAGILEAGRGILTHHFSLFAPDLEKICREAEESLQKNTDAAASHHVFYRLMYRLDPNLKTIFCGEREFGSLTELGEAAVSAASSGNTGFTNELRLLQSSFMDFYAGTILKSDKASTLLQKAALQISQLKCSDMQVAWILGYAFTDKRNIRVGDESFDNPTELLSYLKKVESEQSFSGYIKYIEDHRGDLEFFAAAIPEAKSREALKQVLEDLDRAVFGQGELQFKNSRAFDDYVGRLLREKQTYRLCHILNTYDAALKEVSEKVWHSNSYDNLKRTVSGFVSFEEHLFPSVPDLKAHFEKLLQDNRDTPEFFRKFVSSHSSALTAIEKNSALSQVIGRFRSYASADSGKQANITVKGVIYPTVKPMPKVGEYVKFGSYFQNHVKNKEPIEWLVLEVNDNETVLLSRYGLDYKKYFFNSYNFTWEGSYLRKWLNNDFLKAAFSAEEQRRIKLSKVRTFGGENDTSGGNDTQDLIFCLSLEEAEWYFNDDDERACRPTAHARNQGALINRDNGCCWWWLRSPGFRQEFTSYVAVDGELNPRGLDYDMGGAVRPALRLIWNL
ncbi:protein kinase domain-containing protein [Succinimonas amylolytica]|uniref:protein kinase domain-containing protein n=1 Tax=Succinimonas amylolytica TaxID=83769 RepID=UPI0023A7A6A8